LVEKHCAIKLDKLQKEALAVTMQAERRESEAREGTHG